MKIHQVKLITICGRYMVGRLVDGNLDHLCKQQERERKCACVCGCVWSIVASYSVIVTKMSCVRVLVLIPVYRPVKENN